MEEPADLGSREMACKYHSTVARPASGPSVFCARSIVLLCCCHQFGNQCDPEKDYNNWTEEKYPHLTKNNLLFIIIGLIKSKPGAPFSFKL